MNKTKFLQIRMTPLEKKQLVQKAAAENMDLSTWVKTRLFSTEKQAYLDLLASFSEKEDHTHALAALHDFLHTAPAHQYGQIITDLPEIFEHTFLGNYIAAMVEFAAHQKNVPLPTWTGKYTGESTPHFSSKLPSLRMHLLQNSPIPFKRRNIFIDSSIGARI